MQRGQYLVQRFPSRIRGWMYACSGCFLKIVRQFTLDKSIEYRQFQDLFGSSSSQFEAKIVDLLFPLGIENVSV